MRQPYRVTIFYREPTYELRAGTAGRVYKGSFIVSASSPDSAEAMALREFKDWQKRSSANWVREIVEIRCVEAPPLAIVH